MSERGSAPGSVHRRRPHAAPHGNAARRASDARRDRRVKCVRACGLSAHHRMGYAWLTEGSHYLLSYFPHTYVEATSYGTECASQLDPAKNLFVSEVSILHVRPASHEQQ